MRPPALPNDPLLILKAEDRAKHIYTIGATGSGKTNLLVRLIENEIIAKRAICVLDLRGDLIERILVRLANLLDVQEIADRVCLIDLAAEAYTTSLNPLVGAGDTFSRALSLMSSIRKNAESWGVQLDETLRNGLIALSQTSWSLLEMEPLLTHGPFRSHVLQRVGDPYVKAFFRRYDGLSDDQQRTWSMAALNKVTPLLAIPTLRRVFGSRQGLDWHRLLNQREDRIVLINLAVDRFHEASQLVGGFCVTSLQNAIMARANMPPADRFPVTLVVDEFETMASDVFGSIIAEGRRFGFSLVLSHQNLTQLGHDLREAIRNNVHVQIYFQTGALDAAPLSAEVVGLGDRAAIQQLLISQQVGEALVLRRGRETVQVSTIHSIDQAVSQARLSEIRTACLRSYGRANTAIDQDLAAKAAFVFGSFTQQHQGAQVRHGRRPNVS